jgi:hypothetical protein
MGSMLKKRAKNKGSAHSFEIRFFLPGQGFRIGFYSAESKESALGLFKAEFPNAQTFWIAPARGKALAGPQTQYLVWRKSYGGPDLKSHMVFALDSDGNLLGSIPNVGSDAASLSFNLATRRIVEGNKAHRLEQVDESMASLIGNDVYVQTARSRCFGPGDLDIEPGPEAEA